MTQTESHELVVESHPPLADGPRPSGAPSGPGTAPQARPAADAGSAGQAADLASELRASREWRKTTAGASGRLDGVDLSGEDLRGVDFSGASLADANFANANLADADFSWTKLTHADFTGAVGLVGAQFARSDLTGARLPSSVRFGAFETANEIALSTGKLLLTVLLVCAYSWLTINSTLDAKLLTDTGASQLPILNAEIPIVNFYALVPVALVGLALVTMLQAQRLWAAVAAAPAALPDGTSMTDRAGAWLLGPWAVQRLIPARQRGFLMRLQARLAALVGWWLVPVTVIWFWARYLHRHDWPITLVQLVAITAGCTASIGFLQLAYATLPETHTPRAAPPARRGVIGYLGPYWPTMLVAVCVPVVFGLASYVAIRGVQPGLDEAAGTSQTADERPALMLRRAVPSLQAVMPELLSHVGMRPVAQLEGAEVSTRLATGTTADTTAQAKASGARLIGADLRFASAERVFLPLSDLRHADLLGANLWSADLRGANLSGASFVGALLFDADIRKVRAKEMMATRVGTDGHVEYIDTLFCSRTSFAAANMRNARLNGGDFRGALFDDALLQGATFARARLTHASFAGADLDGTDFRGAAGLTADQVLAAKHVGALFDSTLLASLRARSPERFVGYNAVAIAAQTEAQRLSGEEEPDTPTAAEAAARENLMHRAYEDGPAPALSSSDKNAWVERGRTSPASTDAPPGCVMTRATRERR